MSPVPSPAASIGLPSGFMTRNEKPNNFMLSGFGTGLGRIVTMRCATVDSVPYWSYCAMSSTCTPTESGIVSHENVVATRATGAHRTVAPSCT